MPPRTAGTRHNGMFIDCGMDIGNRNLKLGEIIESRVIRVFSNGQILVDVKGKPTIAAASIGLRQGTIFNAVVRRNGRQKWLQIVDNSIETKTTKDGVSILQSMGLEINELYLLVLQVLEQYRIKPTSRLVCYLGDCSKQYKRIISDQRLLVESIIYLIALAIDVTKTNILCARTLLGHDYLLGEKLDQIRHYTRVSRRRSIHSNESDRLATIIENIALRIPSTIEAMKKEFGISHLITPNNPDSFGQLRSLVFGYMKNIIEILSDTRKELSASGKLNQRCVDLVDQCLRMVSALKITGEMNEDGSYSSVLYFQIPILFDNRISTIEGRMLPIKGEQSAGTTTEGEAIWRMLERNVASVHISSSLNSWQVNVKTCDNQFKQMIEREISMYITSPEQKKAIDTHVDVDDQFIQELAAKDLRWPPVSQGDMSVDLLV